jgi:hypothetical protein
MPGGLYWPSNNEARFTVGHEFTLNFGSSVLRFFGSSAAVAGDPSDHRIQPIPTKALNTEGRMRIQYFARTRFAAALAAAGAANGGVTAHLSERLEKAEFVWFLNLRSG